MPWSPRRRAFARSEFRPAAAPRPPSAPAPPLPDRGDRTFAQSGTLASVQTRADPGPSRTLQAIRPEAPRHPTFRWRGGGAMEAAHARRPAPAGVRVVARAGVRGDDRPRRLREL